MHQHGYTNIYSKIKVTIESTRNSLKTDEGLCNEKLHISKNDANPENPNRINELAK